MDNLSYTYENSGKSNRLQRINDAGVKTVMAGVEHFVDGNTSNTDYLYDNSGNLKQDLNKGISSIVYNHLNKPTTITFSNGKKIQYIYDAAGAKLRQKVFGNGGSVTTVETDYVGPFHYEDADGDGSGATTAIQFFSHEEGRVRRAGSDLIYETFLKDHLGNVRVMFADMNGDGWVDPDPVNGEVLQVDHFYPFGLRMAGLSLVPAVKNSYLFTGKEIQDELGLSWIDFGARMYDAAAGRWNGVDALGEKYTAWSPYNYVMVSPLVFIDPNGEKVINIYAEDYEIVKSRYEEASRGFNSLKKGDDGYNAARRNLKNAKNDFNNIGYLYQEAEKAIYTLKEIDSELFQEIDNLTMKIGGKETEVNVYVGTRNSPVNDKGQVAETIAEYEPRLGEWDSQKNMLGDDYYIPRTPGIQQPSIPGVPSGLVGFVSLLYSDADPSYLANEFGDIQFFMRSAQNAATVVREGKSGPNQLPYEKRQTTIYSFGVQAKFQNLYRQYINLYHPPTDSKGFLIPSNN